MTRLEAPGNGDSFPALTALLAMLDSPGNIAYTPFPHCPFAAAPR